MATITSYLVKRFGVSIEPYQLNDGIEARTAILYHPWDINAQKSSATTAILIAERAIEVLRPFLPLGPLIDMVSSTGYELGPDTPKKLLNCSGPINPF